MFISDLNVQFDRTVVGAEDLLVDRRALDPVTELLGDDEIVDTPADVPITRLHTVGPPAVLIGGIRIQQPDGIAEAQSAPPPSE